MASILQSNKESMMTRNKVAQQKLNPQTMKTLTQLLMRPNITITTKSLLLKNFNEKTNPKNAKTSTPNLTDSTSESEMLRVAKPLQKLKSAHVQTETKKVGRSKSLTDEKTTEFYPERAKRNVAPKKIVLQPKHHYRIVASTNKRKRAIPHRELKYTPTEELELTMTEMVRLADEEGIDDEDLMEILTCPSPVWWEDHNHKEEIRIRFHEDTTEEDTPKVHDAGELENDNPVEDEDAENERSWDQTRETFKTDTNFLQNFAKKRSKLESVLGTIKNKVKPDEPQHDKTDGKPRKDSTSGLSDASINEELLMNLENIVIPVRDDSDCEDNIEKDDLTDNTVKIEAPTKRSASSPNKEPPRIAKYRKRNKLKETSNGINNDRNDEINNEINNESNEVAALETVPAELPPLTKNPFRNVSKKYTFESPKSTESLTSETTNSSVVEFDSISDTNIKFLDEYDDGKTESNGRDDLVTIYRIMPNDSQIDIEDQIKINLVNKSPEKPVNDLEANKDRQLISYYKKIKNAKRKRKNEINAKINGKQSHGLANGKNVMENDIVVKKYKYKQKCRNKVKRIVKIPNTKVKYCHKCSSIFESDLCEYCSKNP